MKEIHTREPETQQQKSSIFAAEATGGSRQAEQEAQKHRPVTPLFTQEERVESHSAEQQQRSDEEPTHTEEQPNDVREQRKAARTTEEKLFNKIFGGETEEQINAHNERIKAEREKEQQEKEKLREEALKQYEKYHARLAAMTPEEREAWERQREKDHTIQPLTPDEFKQLIYKMRANRQAMQRKKAMWMHERDPRYDPMTGDLLESDEHPLDPTAEYTFYGKTRARSFVHPEARSLLSPDSSLLEHREPLQTDGNEEVLESESHERLVARLLKAGFVEVEPTLADKASFERAQWYRNLSASEKMQLFRDSIQEMTRSRSFDKETAGKNAGEKFAEFIELLIDLLIALIAPEMKEQTNRDQSAQKAA